MCNKVATPAKDELAGYFEKQDVNQAHVFKIEDYDHFFHADGFTRPFLPFTAAESPRSIAPARWKLLPHIVKNEQEAVQYANTLNARCEEIFTKFSYKSYIGSNRGLLWVKGFFEPNHPRPKVTVPYFIKAHNGEPFTLGCVYSNWLNHDTGEVIRTFSIITTPPNKLLEQIHTDGQRMPLIITTENRDKWLGALTEKEIAEMMKPLADGYLQGNPVSGLVYKRGVNTNVPETQVPVIQE
ncbi:MAG: SOS response-associated peptidase [Taibaiella sp.]|nr:SOS response-associated peptidase [Taibaiella sp.]